MEFLPVNRRTFPELSAHLKRNGLDAVVDYYQKQRATEISRATSAHLRDMISGTDANEEIIAYLKEQERTKTMPETDFLNLVWNGLVSSIDIAELQDKAGETLLKELKETAPILEPFCQNARAEVSLINSIQTWCYKNTAVSGSFVKILLVLFNADVLSSDAILYWHSKGSKPDGRQNFLKQTEPLVKKLEEQEEEESDEE